MRNPTNHGVLGGAAALAAVIATVAIGAHGAQAHSPGASDSCSGLEVNFQSYEGGSSNNELRVTIDGTASTFTFGASFARTFPWSQSEDHTWTVALDANLQEGDPSAWDYSTSGSESACVVVTTVPETTTTTTAPPETTTTTTVAETTTTTTVADTTSTTVADTTTTTVAATVTAPPTTPAPTTDVDVAVVPPVPAVTPAPPTAAPPVVPATLPATGGSTKAVFLAGLVLLAAGALGVIVARRQGRPA